MFIFFFLIFLILSFFSLFKIKDRVVENFILVIISFVLILISGFRGEGLDWDYVTYKEIFLSLDKNSTYFVEPGFVFITYFVRFFANSVVLLFLIFAILGITIKTYSITKLTDYIFLSLLLYFSSIYILHDLTQIRAGVASGLMLFSLIPLQNKNKYQFFGIVFCAILFHFSAFVLLPIYFLKSDKINKKVWILVIPMSYALLFLSISPIDFYKLIPIAGIEAKVQTYILLQEANEDDKVNVFSTLVLLRILFIIYILRNIDVISLANKYAILLVKIYIIALSILIIMSKTSAIALRFNEFFLTVEFVVLPLILYTVEPKNRIFLRLLLIVFSAILLFFHYRAKTLLIFE